MFLDPFQVGECLSSSCSSHLDIKDSDRIEEEDCIEEECFLVHALSNNIGKFYNPSDLR